MIKINQSIFRILLFFFLLAGLGCTQTSTPKPLGYYRIDLPQKSYHHFDDNCAFSMDVPDYSRIERKEGMDACWFNVVFPTLKARLHLTYLPVDDNLNAYIEDSYNFAFKHEMKANAINRIEVNHPENHVYGLIYELKGNVASSLQFFACDSTNHFVRGALYFDNKPNADSIAPVLQFIQEDVDRMLSTLTWRNDL